MTKQRFAFVHTGPDYEFHQFEIAGLSLRIGNNAWTFGRLDYRDKTCPWPMWARFKVVLGHKPYPNMRRRWSLFAFGRSWFDTGREFIEPAAPVTSAVERAYGALWRDLTPTPQALAARKELLATLDRDGQARGIAWAFKRFGQVSDGEIYRSTDDTSLTPAPLPGEAIR